MLKELRVANLALVEDLALSFGPGLTMITGETGAGKSLIAGALGLLAGGRADKGQIREGEETAVVEAVFDLLDRPAARAAFADAGLRVGADGLLIMRRELKREGRGRVLINGLLSSLSIFERLGPLLLSIQSQDHQRLLTRPGFARDFLDRMLDLGAERERVAAALDHFRTLEKELADRLAEQSFAQEQLEMWEYQHQEISAARLSLQEEEELAERLAFGRNARSLLEGLEVGRQDLLAGEPNARQLLARTLAALEPLAGSSPRLEEILTMVRDAEALVTEAGGELRRFGDSVDVDPARLDELEERQQLYTQLQRKYGRGVSELLALEEKLATRIGRQKQSTSDIDTLRREVERARQELVGLWPCRTWGWSSGFCHSWTTRARPWWSAGAAGSAITGRTRSAFMRARTPEKAGTRWAMWLPGVRKAASSWGCRCWKRATRPNLCSFSMKSMPGWAWTTPCRWRVCWPNWPPAGRFCASPICPRWRPMAGTI